MIRIFLPLICAALGFAAASCSQSEEPAAPTADAPASAPATSHSAASAMPTSSDEPQAPTSDDTSTPPASPDAPTSTPVQRRASTLIGMAVVSADGSSLGAVKDIIFDSQGRAAHLVIAFPVTPPSAPASGNGTGTDAGGKLTAMPWDAAMASIKDGRLVLDGTMLQGAPSFTRDAWPNLDDPAWSAATDAYWRKAVRAAIEANPGAPIDPQARTRARPSRDGN